MLALVWSLCLLFTAIITNTLSRTVKGQVMLLMMMVKMQETSIATFNALFLSVVTLESFSVVFVKFELERLIMLERKRCNGFTRFLVVWSDR